MQANLPVSSRADQGCHDQGTAILSRRLAALLASGRKKAPIAVTIAAFITVAVFS